MGGHIYHQNGGQTMFLEAEHSRKQAAGVDLVRPLVSTSLRESSLARQEINGMDEENVQGKRGVEEDVDDGVVTPSPQVSKRRSKSWPMATQSKERQRILTKIIFVGSLVWE